jgi:hypothetical protein
MAMDNVRTKANDIDERSWNTDRAEASKAKIPNAGLERESDRNRSQVPLAVRVLAVEHKSHITMPSQRGGETIRILRKLRCVNRDAKAPDHINSPALEFSRKVFH